MNTKALLATSLVVNVLSLGAAALAWQHIRGTVVSSPGAVVHVTNVNPAAVEQPTAAAPTVEPTTPTLAANTKVFDWRRVESPDYRQYLSNLRATGCPEETIRDIIKADINKLYEARFKELLSNSTNKFQFWKTGGNPLGNMLDETLMQKRHEWGEEKKALFKTLMGTDASDTFDLASGMNLYKAALDFLPEDKQAQLAAHEERWAARQMNSMKAMQDGDVNAIRNLQREKDADLAAILTPQEKEEYDLRMSETAILMRVGMGDFQPTEQQFRDIFKLQKQFDDDFGEIDPQFGKPEDLQKRNAAKTALDNQIKEVLGNQRFADYQREQQWINDPLRLIAKEFNVPKETAIQVMDIKSAVQQQVQQLRTDQSLSVEQRQAALRGIRTETASTISQIIGSEAAKAYVDRAGYWLPAPGGKKGKGKTK